MSFEEEYAPRYTQKQAVRHALAWGVFAIALVFLFQKWLFPAWTAFAESAPCRVVLGVPAWKIVWYGTFVALPLCLTLLTGRVLGLRGYRILRDGQVPYKGEKVYRPTVIVRGCRSRWIGYAHLLPVILMLAISGWGYGWATKWLREVPVPKQGCARPRFMETVREPGGGADRYRMVADGSAL